MMTLIPRPAASLANFAVLRGARCAEVTSISYAIPKPSSDLAHSFMISRSESEPITMETSGLLKLSLLFFYQRTGADIFAVIHSFEADLPGRFISAIKRDPEVTRPRGDSEHAPTRGDEVVPPLTGSG